MTEEETTTIKVKEEPKETVRAKRTGVGASLVPPVGIVLITAYLILAAVLLLYGLVQFWPPPAPATGSAPTSSPVAFLFWTLSVSDEVRLIFIVALAGALVGMFSEQAVLKLKEVAETLLAKPEPGEDAVPQEEEGESDSGG
jgi:hypothetical protein